MLIRLREILNYFVPQFGLYTVFPVGNPRRVYTKTKYIPYYLPDLMLQCLHYIGFITGGGASDATTITTPTTTATTK